MKKTPAHTNSTLLAIIACLLWSTAFAGIKIGLPYTTPIHFAGVRFMLSGLLLLPFCGKPTQLLQMIREHRKFILTISLSQTAFLYGLFYLGVSLIPAAVAAIVVGASPLFVALMAHFTIGKEKLTLRKILALTIGFTGIILLALRKDTNADNQNQLLLGIGILVVANISGSYGNILIAKQKTKLPALPLNALQIFLGGFLLFVFSFFIEDLNFSIKPLPYYLALGWLSILSAVALSLWFIIIKRHEVKVSEVNIWKFVIPVFGALISWAIIEDESASWNTLVAMVIIASSVLIINYPGIRSYVRKFMN